MKRELGLKALVLGFGFFVTALGTSFFIGSNLGSDGYTLVSQGLAHQIGCSVGIASTLLALIMMCAVFFVDRSYLKIATLISLVVIGPSIDFWSWLCGDIHRFLNQNLALQLVCVSIAIFIVALGVSIVMSAHLGTHINDSIPVILATTVGKRWQFRVSKIAWDFFVLAVGILLGGVFGIGTVLAALCLGPILQALIPISEGFVSTRILGNLPQEVEK